MVVGVGGVGMSEMDQTVSRSDRKLTIAPSKYGYLDAEQFKIHVGNLRPGAPLK